MKKSVIIFFIVFAMIHVAWSKSEEKTNLEEFRFSILTHNSLSCASLYKLLENKRLSDKHGSLIMSMIYCNLMTIRTMLLSEIKNDNGVKSSIYGEIKSNSSILVKLITSKHGIKNKNITLLKTLTYLLLLPISEQDKELVQQFMKENYSITQINTEKEKAILQFNSMKSFYSLTPEEFSLMTVSYLNEYTNQIRILSLFLDDKTAEIKCIFRNKIVYNHILISLIIKRDTVKIKEGYVDYQNNLVIQNIISDYKTRKGLMNPPKTNDTMMIRNKER